MAQEAPISNFVRDRTAEDARPSRSLAAAHMSTFCSRIDTTSISTSWKNRGSVRHSFRSLKAASTSSIAQLRILTPVALLRTIPTVFLGLSGLRLHVSLPMSAIVLLTLLGIYRSWSAIPPSEWNCSLETWRWFWTIKRIETYVALG